MSTDMIHLLYNFVHAHTYAYLIYLYIESVRYVYRSICIRYIKELTYLRVYVSVHV